MNLRWNTHKLFTWNKVHKIQFNGTCESVWLSRSSLYSWLTMIPYWALDKIISEFLKSLLWWKPVNCLLAPESSYPHHESPRTFPEDLLVHTIRQSKLFVLQTLLEIAELKHDWVSGCSRYVKIISSEMNPE